MKETPIIFSTEMVRAVLDGRKTQTRRVVQPQPTKVDCCYLEYRGVRWMKTGDAVPFIGHLCPYGAVGDHLWVRETFVIESNFNLDSEENYPPPFQDGRPVRRVSDGDYGDYWQQCHYRATDPKPELVDTNTDKECCWRPAIYMPRWASRIALEITNLRAERLQELTEGDAVDEGFGRYEASSQAFIDYWDGLNAKRGFGWDANPLVWVVTFRRVES